MNNTPNPATPKSHKVRTFFASIAGIVAIYLIFSSIAIIWLNQTITNTSVYVNTVAPLVTKPAIQNFIAQEVTNDIVSSAPTQNLANALLSPSELNASLSDSQLVALIKPVLQSTVLQIVRSASFAALWRNTNQTAHAELISQLNNNSNQLDLNLNPAINGVINELKSSRLSTIASQVSVSPNTGNLDIKNSGVSKVHRIYKLFQEGTIALLVIALLFFGLSIWLSVHHAKTLRRILIGSGILALIQALILEAPAVIPLKGSNQITQNAIRAFAEAILHNLQLANLLIGVIFILIAIASKIYSKLHSANKAPVIRQTKVA